MLLETARKDAAAMLGKDATLSLPEHEALGAAVLRLTSGPGDVN
jgi:hypothetical protein